MALPVMKIDVDYILAEEENTEGPNAVVVTATHLVLQETVTTKVEYDHELDELRVIVDDECVSSVLFRRSKPNRHE